MKLKQIYEELLSEVVSDVLYHLTIIARLTNILESNQFRLTSTSDPDEKVKSGKYDYFLSMARSRQSHSIASRESSRGLVILTMNRDKLKSRYRIRPVDYWGSPISHKTVRRNVEMEDRLLSNSKMISDAINYIDHIDILVPVELSDKNVSRLNLLLPMLSSSGIPFSFYNDKQSFLLGNKNKALDSDEVAKEVMTKSKKKK